MPKLTVKRSCGCWETHIYRSTPRAAQTLISRLQAGPCARCRDRQHLRPMQGPAAPAPGGPFEREEDELPAE
jgi:hypothetical protein